MKGIRSILRATAYRFFPIWLRRREAEKFERSFKPSLEKAKQDRDWEEQRRIQDEMFGYGREYWDEFHELETILLLRKASRLHVNVARSVEDASNWHQGHFGHRYLVGDVFNEVHRLVVQGQRETWEFRLKIVGVVGTILAALTGIIGAVIGLVAVLKN